MTVSQTNSEKQVSTVMLLKSELATKLKTVSGKFTGQDIFYLIHMTMYSTSQKFLLS